MKVIIDKEQLAHISNLIEKKGVNFYDVKMEMTDHVASEVEEEIENSGLEYMKAVKKVFSRYDRFHFMRIEEEQQKKLQRQSWNLLKKGLISFFTIPKIIATAMIYLFFVTIIGVFSKSAIVLGVGILTIIFVSILIRKKFKWFGKKQYVQMMSLSLYLSIGFSPIWGVLANLDFDSFSLLHDAGKEISILKLFISSGFYTLILLLEIVGFEIANNELLRLKKAYS